MRLQRTLTLLAGTAGIVLTAGALLAGPAAAAPASASPAHPAAASPKIAPRASSTQTNLRVSPAQATLGQEGTVDFTITVSSSGQGGGLPTGQVTVLNGTTPVCTATLSTTIGHCHPTSSQLPPGDYMLHAHYAGDFDNFQSDSTGRSLTIVKAPTFASLTPSPTTVQFGQESTMDLTVAIDTNGGPAPTGRVSVVDEGTGAAICSADLPVGANNATCRIPDTGLPVGTHALDPRYDGDANYNSAQFIPADITINKDPTSLTLRLPAGSLSVSQEAGAQLRYRITPAAALPGTDPSGTVTITDGNVIICSDQIHSFTGSCDLGALAHLSPGTYQLTATYSGDGNLGDSASVPQTLTITPDAPPASPTSTALTLSAPRATFGHEQAEHLTAHVTAAAGTPAGQVTIKAGTASVCVVTLTNGTGSCTPGATRLRPGTHKLTATYAGRPAFQASTSGTKTLTVAAEPTATTLKLSAARVRSGHEQAEHLTVLVKPQFSGTPAGKVTIKAGKTRICTITLKNGKGSCTLKASQLRSGTYHLTATYPLTTPFAGSTSPKKPLTITK